MGKKQLSTPIIKPRTQGGTFYTFASAIEDIGLNINESSNKVRLSKYVLLNLPETFYSGFNYASLTDDDEKFAMAFENYLLNMETAYRNKDGYDFSKSLNISERCFWKTLKKYGWTNFKEEGTSGYFYDASTCVKAFGDIVAGSQRDDEYGIYNETFVQIPSSYGSVKVLFKPTYDKNMTSNFTAESYDAVYGKIEYIDSSNYDSSSNTINVNGYSVFGFFDSSTAVSKSYTTSNDGTDVLCATFDVNEYNDVLGKEYQSIDEYLKESPSIGSNKDYDFNSILVYYSIYDSTSGKEVATNAYGLLVLNKADGTGHYPSLVKKQSTDYTVGTSYSFRINIKTSSVYGGDMKVTDNSTPAFSMSEDFNDVLRNLSVIVDKLKTNTATLSSIASDYSAVKALAVSAKSKADDLEKTINAISNLYTKERITIEPIADMDNTKAQSIINNTIVSVNDNNEVCITLDTDSITDSDTKKIAESMVQKTTSNTYVNTASLLALCIKLLKNSNE